MTNIFSADFAGRNFSLKTNYVAAQADGSMLVYYGDTVVLVTAVSLKSVREGVDFLAADGGLSGNDFCRRKNSGRVF